MTDSENILLCKELVKAFGTIGKQAKKIGDQAKKIEELKKQSPRRIKS